MKNRIKNIVLCLFATFLVACENQTTPENLIVQKPIEHSSEYWANLKAYKNSNHSIAFGWFGGWTATGASVSTSLSSVPDSVDLITIWGDQWQKNKMTPEKYADLKYVQNVKGTKVAVTILLGWLGKDLDPSLVWPKDRTEAIKAYADALADDIIGRGFDGFDIDYEPNIGTQIDVEGCFREEEMILFVQQLGKYFGPKSGTDKLLIVDGEISYLVSSAPGVGQYFNYAVAQAYGASSDRNLQGRFDAIKTDFKPEQFIVTEDFESGWRKGGLSSYNSTTHGRVPNLIGMAYWNPKEGRKGGAGTYHMENEYNHQDVEYKYLRNAIQIMNPSVISVVDKPEVNSK